MNSAPMSLAERQEAFLAAILDEGAPLPKGWGNSQAAGMSVYRGNYRHAVMSALAETFERTALYLGEAGFRQASINHVIAHPPSGWTIDEAGAGFDATCAEVAELAWLEWTMVQLATAPDTTPMSAEGFGAAVADFGDEQWGTLRLTLQPRACVRTVDHDLTALWQALGQEDVTRPELRLPQPQTCLVWREGERPTFILLEADHAAAFAAIQNGATYTDMIGAALGDDPDPSPEAIQNAAMRAGAMLGRWLQEGVVVGLT